MFETILEYAKYCWRILVGITNFVDACWDFGLLVTFLVGVPLIILLVLAGTLAKFHHRLRKREKEERPD